MFELNCLCHAQDRDPLAPLQEPVQDDLRTMLEQVLQDTCQAAEGHNVQENLLEATLVSFQV